MGALAGAHLWALARGRNGMPAEKAKRCQEVVDIWRPHGCFGLCFEGVDDLTRAVSAKKSCNNISRGLYALEKQDLMICCHAKQVEAFKERPANAGELWHVCCPFRFWFRRMIWQPLLRAGGIVVLFIALVVGLIWPMGDTLWRYLPFGESFGRKLEGPHARGRTLQYESELAPLKRREAFNVYSPDISIA